MKKNSPKPKPSGIRADEQVVLPEPLQLLVEYMLIDELEGYNRHTRRYAKKQLRKLEAGIAEFGFIVPALVDHEDTVIAGHARILAAKMHGLSEVPVIRLSHLSPAQVRAFRIFDNRIAEEGEWDRDKLALEFQYLVEVNFDVTLTGFEIPEIDLTIGEQLAPVGLSPEDIVPQSDDKAPATSVVGDLWIMDKHRLLCADARKESSYIQLMNGEQADANVSDIPYNAVIQGNVGGSGSIRHAEFVMASGEMSEGQFLVFLDDVVRWMAWFSRYGSLHYLFMDWRNLYLLDSVCRKHFDDHINTLIWAKSNGGMGSFYRSRHEMILLYKKGEVQHINNIQLGKYKRNRTNVLEYEGCNSLNPERRADLALHPTVKPVALIADLILDCTHRNGIVLDAFTGSGTIFIACEKTARVGYGLELDPGYCDTAVRRWQSFTGSKATHAQTGLTFDEMTALRNTTVSLLPAPSTSGEEGQDNG